MKERGMIFNTEMVNAILDGRKTQTRRPVKWSKHWPIEFVGGKGSWGDPSCWGFEDRNTAEWWILEADRNRGDNQIPCPFGRIGNQLWVRETFRLFNSSDECGCEEYPCGCPNNDQPVYLAHPKANPNYTAKVSEYKWTPSIHMPRWASRIQLEITNVRVERVQDISEEDAISEGVAPNCSMINHDNCEHDGEYLSYPFDPDGFPAYSAKESFMTLWQSIYGEDAWSSNQWVWVIDFKQVK